MSNLKKDDCDCLYANVVHARIYYELQFKDGKLLVIYRKEFPLGTTISSVRVKKAKAPICWQATFDDAVTALCYDYTADQGILNKLIKLMYNDVERINIAKKIISRELVNSARLTKAMAQVN